MKDFFRLVSNKVSAWTGSAYSFLVAVLIIIIWVFSGPAFHFSDTWQLVINTGTTIITFLMVFLIQNTQNRDSKAMQLKLDELIRTTGARNSFVDLEDMTDEELGVIDEQFKRLHEAQPSVQPAIHKLHTKIAAEHSRRLSMKSQAGHVLNTLFNPLSGKDKK